MMRTLNRLTSVACLLALSGTSYYTFADSVGELNGQAFVSEGRAGYQIALPLPDGVNGLVPALSIRYQQGSANGPLGLGMSLDGLSQITRCARNKKDDGENGGISLDNSDAYCLDGQRLFHKSGQKGKDDSTYRLKGNWQTNIVADDKGNTQQHPSSWNVYSADGYITRYGATDDAQFSIGLMGMTWFISTQTDRFGNRMDYRYQTEQGQHYLSEIEYADVTVTFNYTARSDALTAYQFGKQQVLAQKLETIEVKRNETLLNRFEFSYEETDSQGIALTRLNSVRACGTQGECMPAHTFEWESNPYAGSEPEQTVIYQLNSFKGFVAGDINRDGLSDLCYLRNGIYCGLNQGNGVYSRAIRWSSDFQGSEWEEAQNYASLNLLDINDDSYPDLCAFNETGFFCALNRSGKTFAKGRYWSQKYTIEQAVRLLDTNNDGLTDICRVEENRVVCANNTGNRLSSDYVLINHGYPLEKSYPNMPAFIQMVSKNKFVKWPQSQFIDINQDGFIDLCGIKADSNFYCSLGTQPKKRKLTFKPPQRWASQLPIGVIDTANNAFSIESYNSDADTVQQLQRTMNLVDLNGDGLVELCYRNGNNYVCHQNTGKNFKPGKVKLALPFNAFEMSDDSQNNVASIESSIMVSDRNNDGLADFCYIAGERVYCAYGDGNRFRSPTLLATINADLDLLENTMSYTESPIKKLFGIRTTVQSMLVNNVYGPFKKGIDANGDGVIGDCYRSIRGLTCLSYQTQPLALLKSVTSGLGVKSEFEYDQTSHDTVFQSAPAPEGLFSLTPNLKVVSALRQDNGIGGVSRTEYRYQGYFAHKDKGLLGFGEIQVHDLARNAVTSSITAYSSDITPYLAETQTRVNQQKIAQNEYHYQEVNAPIRGKRWLQLSEKTLTTWDLSGELMTRETTRYDGYDELSFPENITQTIEDGNGEQFIENTTTRYQHATHRWLIGKPVEIAVTKSNSHDSQTRRTAFSYDTVTGALLEQVKEPGHPLSLTTQFTYSANGQRLSEKTTGSDETRQSATTYDNYGRVTQHTNPQGHTVSTTYDNTCGLPATITDANGLTTQFTYDDYCREAKKTFPDGNWTQRVYQWSDGADAGLDHDDLVLGDRSTFMVTTQTSQGAQSTTYFDPLSREVRTTQLSSDGKTIIVDKAYDAKGQLAGETVPYFAGYFAGDATYWKQTRFDDLGRPILQTQETETGGDLTATTRYQGLTTIITGPGNIEKMKQANGLGQTIQTTENGLPAVRYTYDAVGNLIQTDANGLITELSYNVMGHKTQMQDPAMGNWRYGYNAWGELIWQQDALGQLTNFTYDALGRKTAESRPDGVSQWQYDQAQKGSLDSATSTSSQRRYTYDELGRAASMTLTVDGTDYITSYQYNEQGRLSRITYPSGLKLDKAYDINGLLQRVSIPFADIWDSQYLQIEQALQETTNRIVEIEAKAYELEKSAQFYIDESERLRQAAQQLLGQQRDYQQQVRQLNASALSLFRSAGINATKAQHYRNAAQFFLTRFKNRVLDHYKTQNGYAYYKFDRCVKKSKKRNCKKREYFSAQIPMWMVETRRCFAGKRQTVCQNGPQAQVNVTQVYTRWANHYGSLARNQRAKAQQDKSQAAKYQRLANNAQKQADELLSLAKQNAELARQETDLLAGFMGELDDLVAAEGDLQQAMDQRLNDDSAEILWVATSRDNFGQIQGELFGNGLLTRRELDRSRGTVQRITTGTGSNLIRDIRYTYDERNNVLSKISAVRNQEEYYRYDDLDRLVQWNYADNTSAIDTQRDYRYDVYGNLTYKTGQGDFDVRPNGQLTQGYTYDANGNMLTGRGRTLSWTSFNKARQINDNGVLVQYEYGSERERVKQTSDGTTTYYISPEYELQRTTQPDGKTVTVMRHRVIADQQAVAEHMRTMINDEKQIDRTAYFHRDALGSADLITDPNGRVQIERGYTPFGELLASAELQSAPLFTNADMRGFTGHENVGNSSGLINMNARLYDPVIGRFLSADTLVPDPSFSQSYNRYAYVYNNPLKYTDPSGHFIFFVAAMAFFVVSQTFNSPIIQMAGMVVGAIALGAAAYGAFAALQPVAQAVASGATVSFTTNYIVTGDLNDSLQAGLMGGATAAITYGVAHGSAGGTSPFGRALPLAHGVVQGGMNEAQGGSFKQGFISGVIGKAGGAIVHQNTSSSIQQAGGMIVVSGIAAAASGANSRDAILRSAMNVIVVYLYNDLARMKEMNRRSALHPTDWKELSSDVSSASSWVATGCIISAILPCYSVASGISLASGFFAVSLDLMDSEKFNETYAAGVSNSILIDQISRPVIKALPPTLEIPVRIGFDASSQFSNFLFKEADANE